MEIEQRGRRDKRQLQMGEVKLLEDNFLKSQIMTIIKYKLRYKTCQRFYLNFVSFII